MAHLTIDRLATVIERLDHDAIPLNRYGSEKEIAEAFVFLALPKAGYVTGQCLAADGRFGRIFEMTFSNKRSLLRENPR